MTAAALLLALVGHHCGPQPYERQVLRSSPLSISSLGGELGVKAEQIPLPGRPSAACNHVFATASLAPSTTDLIAFAVAAAVVAMTGLLVLLVVPAGRGPPRGLASVLTGQDLLTRFCLSRR